MNRWLQEPLVHFVLLGGLLFAAYSLLDRDAMDTPQVVRISAAEVDWLKHTWSRQWQRPPDESELRGLVTGYLKEVLLAREAQALGLVPVAIFVAYSLPGKLPIWLRWLASAIITAAIGYGLYVLIPLFVLWFHFAVGGSS